MRPRATALWLLIHTAGALAPDRTRTPVVCRDARTQRLHFAGLVEASLLRKGIGKDAPVIVVRMRPLSRHESAADPSHMLCDADGTPFEACDAATQTALLARGPAVLWLRSALLAPAAGVLGLR